MKKMIAAAGRWLGCLLAARQLSSATFTREEITPVWWCT